MSQTFLYTYLQLQIINIQQFEAVTRLDHRVMFVSTLITSIKTNDYGMTSRYGVGIVQLCNIYKWLDR